MTTNAAASGQFKLLGKHSINRLGFGAMRITGKGIWGPPADLEAAKKTLRRLPELGVDFIDTADSYGPEVSEELIRQTLHPYKGLTIATKGGLARTGPDIWLPLGRPEYLRQCVMMSLRRLNVEQITLWQLHRIDAKVPQNEQFDVIKQMQKEGLIRDVGLSEVNVAEIEAAQKFFQVATVQNQYNLFDRKSEDVLDYCAKHAIGFIPWFPLGAGSLAAPRDAGEDGQEAACVGVAAGAGVDAQALAGDAADSGHVEPRASRRERGRGRDQAVGRGLRDARQSRARLARRIRQ